MTAHNEFPLTATEHFTAEAFAEGSLDDVAADVNQERIEEISRGLNNAFDVKDFRDMDPSAVKRGSIKPPPLNLEELMNMDVSAEDGPLPRNRRILRVEQPDWQA